VGITARYSEDGPEVWAKTAFLKFKVYPAKEKPAKAEKPVKDTEKETEEKAEEKGGPFDAIKKYYDIALGLLKNLRKVLRIDLLKVRFVAAAKDDAAKAAILYGKAWAAEGIILAVLENNIRVRKKEIDILVDYVAEKPAFYCFVKASATIGGLILAGFRIAKDNIFRKVKEKGGAENGKANS
jgi:hypothetical protein